MSVGEKFDESDPNVIREMILNIPDRQWMNGTGVSVFTYYSDDIPKSKIAVYGSNGCGFSLIFQKIGNISNNQKTFNLVNGLTSEETCRSASGGNIFLAFKEYFVPKETAWQVIEYFLETGEMLEGLNWTTEYKVPDDF